MTALQFTLGNKIPCSTATPYGGSKKRVFFGSLRVRIVITQGIEL
jgi:hypothetical protein